MYIQGCTQQQIAAKLSVSLKTISRDFQELKTESKEWMNNLPEGEIQLYHKRNLETIEKVNQELWKLYENAKDEDKKIKILNMISSKCKTHIDMMTSDKLWKLRSSIQGDLKIKSMFGKYRSEM